MMNTARRRSQRGAFDDAAQPLGKDARPRVVPEPSEFYKVGQTVILHNLTSSPDLSEALGNVERYVAESLWCGVPRGDFCGS